MEFKETNNINNVSSYLADMDTLIWSEGSVIFKNGTELISPKIESNCLNIAENGGCLFFWFGSGDLWIYSESDSYLFKHKTEKKVLANKFFVHCLDFDYDLLVPVSNFYDLKNNSLILEKGLLGHLSIFKDSIFQFSENLICRFSLNSTLIWQHDLSHLGNLEGKVNQEKDSFQKFLGVTHSNLWVLTQSGKIIAIDNKAGDLTKTFEWTDEYADGERYRPNPTEAFTYEGNYIYSLGRYFIKINAKTLEIEEKRILLDAAHDGEKIEIRTSSFQGRHISFIASTYGTSWVKIIGLFSIKEEKIIWTYQLFDNEENRFIPVFNTPQLAGNKLYILDNEKTLHIFENGEQV